jgi:hypothetical protein
VAWTLDLSPVVRLQKQMWRGAVFTGSGVYLEAILALVFVTERSLSPSALIAIVIILIAQLFLIFRPVRLLLRGRLVRAYQTYLALFPAFTAAMWLGTSGDEHRPAAVVLSTLLVMPATWVAVRTMKMAREMRPVLTSLADDSALEESLSFSMTEWFRIRLRAAGGDRRRWAAPAVAALAVFAATAATLALLSQAIGVNPSAPVAQVATLLAVFVFYRGMRLAKLNAAQLRERDRRAPVLILRQFRDDFLESGKMGFGGTPTFEHFVAAELNRIGPVVAIGRPGERVQPLGASRDYVDGVDWRGRVGTTMADAALVVVILGDSDSVLWEFRTAIETRGKTRTLIVVPPLPDRAELASRWARFSKASADILGPGFPAELPAKRLLAVAFSGEDAVMVVNDERPRKRALIRSGHPDYRLLFRLFERLLRQDVTSPHGLDVFLKRAMPIATIQRT